MAKAARGLTISQRENGSWRAQIRKKGFPYESRDFLTHEEADEWGLRRLAEIHATGRLVDRRPAERTTFGATIEQYIIDVTRKRPGGASRVAEEARLRRFLREEKRICSYSLANLAPKIFVEWRDRRLTEAPSRGRRLGPNQDWAEATPAGRYRLDGRPRANAAKPKPAPKPLGTISPGTVKREITLLKRVCDFAMRHHNLTSNPLDVGSVDRPTVQDSREVRISDDEWSRLLQECRNTRNIWLAPFVELALEIGARRKSLLTLAWADVKFDERSAILRDVKNSNSPNEIRTVEVGLSPRAVEILSALPRSVDGRVFPIARDALKSAFGRARRRANLDHFRLHDSRHEMASRLVEAGWEILDIMAQGDWRDPKSVRRYYTARGAHLGRKLAATRRNGGP